MLFIKSRSKLWFSSQLKLNNLKIQVKPFLWLAGLGRAHNIFQCYNLSGANSVAVCVLRQSLLKQATAFYKRND